MPTDIEVDTPGGKRMRTEEDDTDMEEVSGSSGGGASSGGAPVGVGRGVKGMPFISCYGPLKRLNNHTKHYTKKFYIKIYANNWIIGKLGSGTALTGYQTVIPWHALCMYLSPDEYLEIIRESSHATLDEVGFEMKFKAVRTPFGVNNTETGEANGNLQFELKRWDGLERIVPFEIMDVDETGTQNEYVTNAELIQRLYGIDSFYSLQSAIKPAQLPATMQERSFSWRPVWRFENDHASAPEVGPHQINPNLAISSIPIGEYEHESFNTNMAKMDEGFCFNKVYKPKSNLLCQARSAFGGNRTSDSVVGRTLIKQRPTFVEIAHTSPVVSSPQYSLLMPSVALTLTKTKFFTPDDNLSEPREVQSSTGGTNPWVPSQNQSVKEKMSGYFTAATDGVTNATLANGSTIQDVGYGYAEAMDYYTYAHVENYHTWNAGHDQPLQKLESMLIGAVPKTNRDGSIVNATFEFEVSTYCRVSTKNAHANYYQLAKNIRPGEGALNNDGTSYSGTSDLSSYMRNIDNTKIWGNQWQTSEGIPALKGRWTWDKSYGHCGLMNFMNLPATAPASNVQALNK